VCLFLQFEVKEPGVAILRQTTKYICAGDTGGNVGSLLMDRDAFLTNNAIQSVFGMVPLQFNFLHFVCFVL